MRITIARYYTPTGKCLQKPYTGDYEEYLMEQYDRYSNGELFAIDSSIFVDSLKFETPKGKVVYGGGGITPDVFIPMLSHVTIYKLIREDKKQGGELYKYLINSGKKYKKRYGSSDKRGQIPDKMPIEERLKEIDLKQRIGDFEVDLIIGKNHKGAQLTIVDRATSFTLIQILKTKRSSEVSKAII